MLCSNDRIAGLPVGAPVEPPLERTSLYPIALVQQLVDEGARIAANWLLQVGFQLAKFSRIHIDGNFVGFAGQILRCIAGNRKVQPHTDGQQEVRILQGEVGAARSDTSRSAHVGGILRRHQVRGAPCCHGGNVEKLAQHSELGLCAREPYAVAGKQQRTLAAIEGVDRTANLAADVGILVERSGVLAYLSARSGAMHPSRSVSPAHQGGYLSRPDRACH